MNERYVALFDVDNTIYNGYIIFPLAELQVKEGIINTDCLEQLQRDTQAYRSQVITYETFARDAMRHWAIGLAEKGKSYSEVLGHAETFLKGEGNNFFPYFSRVVHMLNKTYDIYLVTAEPQFVTQAVKTVFPITDAAYSKFEVVNGVFTGEAQVLASGQDKSSAIDNLLTSHTVEKSFGFGDSGSDIDMLERVNFPICVSPNDTLKAYAIKRGWSKYITDPEGAEDLVKSLLT